MSFSTVGCSVRSRLSVQPVHSWKWSQITEGRRAWAMALATAPTALVGRPMAAVMPAQTWRNRRRGTPNRRSTSSKSSWGWGVEFAMAAIGGPRGAATVPG
jgi:NhaP-type Na+/H+ or K+/H+ antiporter